MYIDFCSALAALVGLVQNIFFSPYTISIPYCPQGPATLQIILELCIPEKELAKTRSQI